MPSASATRPLRILNISAQKPDSTGSGTYLAETVRCQDAAGASTAVVCGISIDDGITSLPAATRVFPVCFDTPELPFHVCGMSDVMPYPSTRYRDLTGEMTALFEKAFVRTLRQAAHEFQPDLVICHHLYLVTALARETMPRVPMAAICHSTDVRQMRQHALERDRIIAGVQGLDRILALHEGQISDISEIYEVAREKVSVVGVGYRAQIFSQPPIRLLFAGKICRKKGVPCLLNALDMIDPALAHGRDIELYLAGGHSGDESEYQAIAEQAQNCRWPVYMLGKLDQDELAQRYQSSDVFVLPSFFEGLPLVVIEALACGCRVVATELPGVRPWLEEHVPHAPVQWVTPPRLENVDEPVQADLPSFEKHLARALEVSISQAVQARPTCDTASLSWEQVTARILHALDD